jgi:hypothetical protein
MTVQQWIEMGRSYVDYHVPKHLQLKGEFTSYHDGVHAYAGLGFSDEEEQCVLAWVEGLCGGIRPYDALEASYYDKGEEASYMLPVCIVQWIRASAS